ncbi:MAG: amidohydrolase, partial [Gemmatimonadetes bacterium]|nr:amidohydrolase [Gemmatimonadota bacterium]
MVRRLALIPALLILGLRTVAAQQTATETSPAAKPTDPRIERLKAEALTKVEARAKQIQEMVDMVFSFGELGMQEFETSKYLTGILEQNGFA